MKGLTVWTKVAQNGPFSAYLPDHHLIPKDTCPEGAETPRVKNFGEVGPLAPSHRRIKKWTGRARYTEEKSGLKSPILCNFIRVSTSKGTFITHSFFNHFRYFFSQFIVKMYIWNIL